MRCRARVSFGTSRWLRGTMRRESTWRSPPSSEGNFWKTERSAGEVPSVSPSYRNFGGVAALSHVSASHYHSSFKRSSDSKKREGPRDTESEIASGAAARDGSHKDYPFFSQHPKAAADLAGGRAATPESPISPTSAALLPPLPPSRLPVRHCLFQLGSPCRPSICLDQGATRQPTSARCASIITATR